jgi:putative hydroxymethylpyrimidine transport system substrate-binding protein
MYRIFLRHALLPAALVILLAAPSAQAADKLTLLLDWFVNPDHAPLFVAQERGYFVQHGLEVEMIAPADPNDPPKLVAAGQADIAITYQPQLYLQVAAGLPLTRFGTLIATPLNTLLVLADGPVKSIADLKGRKVGYSIGGFEDALLRAMLARHGLGLDDITLVNVNFSLPCPACRTGRCGDRRLPQFRTQSVGHRGLCGARLLC